MELTGEKIADGVRHFRDRRYGLCCDIGQSVDPTAISVIEHIAHSHITIKNAVIKKWDEFRVVYLERLLGVDYVQQVQHVHQLYARPPLYASCDFGIDDTGVGRAVGDMFVRIGMNPDRFTITAGDKPAPKGGKRFHVPKSFLISILDAKLHSGELKISDKLRLAPALKSEMQDFQRHVSDAGRFSYSARVGKSDDIILSLSLNLFMLVGRKKPQPAIITQARLT